MQKKNILLIGSGGREHAIAWKLKQSKHLNQLFIAPGNPGTALCGINLPVQGIDFDGIKRNVLENNIDFVIVGPEEPLVLGLHDFFLADSELMHIPIIGPQKVGAALEGSKDFAKKFMVRHSIPTARYNTFTADTIDDAYSFLLELSPPYVLKADGLAAGKGVVIVSTFEEAKKELAEMLIGKKFGLASQSVVIEEFLKGIELSVFAVTDGENYLILPEAKDYKRIGERDTGLNTGGMGSVSPVPFADSLFKKKVEDRIIKPTIDGLKKDGIPYRGFIFVGLMNVDNDPYVIEYNVRMGDPETESVMPRIKNDLVELFVSLTDGSLGSINLEFDNRVAATIMIVSGGYPEEYEKGKVISGLELPGESLVFHAGTTYANDTIVTSGGRVLAVTSFGETISSAIQKSLRTAEKIKFSGAYYRTDIGLDLI